MAALKRFLIFALAVCAWGQGTLFTSGPQIPTVTVATLPAAASASGQYYGVTDANPNCGTGGGTTGAICYSNGSIWITMAGGSGGGTGPSLSVLTDFAPTVTSGTGLTIAGGTYSAGTTQFTFGSSTTFTLTQYTISSISSASSAILTISGTPPAGSIHIGEYVQVSGTTGSCTGLNGLQQVTGLGTLAITIAFNSASCSATGGGSAYVGNNPSASGTAYVYADAAGAIHLEHPTTDGLIVVCSGSCAVGQVTTPSFNSGGTVDGEKPIATVTITTTGGGNWGTATNQNSYQNYKPLVPGTGLTLTVGASDTISVTSDVVRASAANTFTGKNDFGSASGTTPNKIGLTAALPATCTVGQTYFETDATAGSNIELCTTTNTWTAISGGGGGSGTVSAISHYFPTATGGNGYNTYSLWFATFGQSPTCAATSAAWPPTAYPQCYMVWYESASNTDVAAFTDTVPSGWTSGTVTVTLSYRGNGFGNAPIFRLSTSCVANGTAIPPTFNAAQNFATTTTSGNNLVINTVSGVTMTGCAAGYQLSVAIARPTDASGYAYVYGATVAYAIP